MRVVVTGGLIAMLSGCLIGAGPVVAVRHAKVKLGWEASINAFAAGVEGGASGGDRSYAAFRYLVRLHPGRDSSQTFGAGLDYDHPMHATAMLGYAFGDGPAAGASAMGVFGERGCSRGSFLFGVAVGLRTLGGASELFVAPKLYGNIPAPCD